MLSYQTLLVSLMRFAGLGLHNFAHVTPSGKCYRSHQRRPAPFTPVERGPSSVDAGGLSWNPIGALREILA